jgi:DNA modification methylase
MCSIELHNENCFDFLPKIESKTVDLILIDPPYLISRNTNFQSGSPKGKDTDRFRISMEFGEWDKGFQDFQFVLQRRRGERWYVCSMKVFPVDNHHFLL